MHARKDPVSTDDLGGAAEDVGSRASGSRIERDPPSRWQPDGSDARPPGSWTPRREAQD
eukprot:CAMPEP_0204521370 /NCGR_PEP_ID=MMETSP0661-20131031/5741_1 /ASSEMBLY_ACC=CAM_ASM_000606 /TAXON_ID=109239 /ORGANISM="Alexandrium margalefi, Strain AMGDE01CS-322" /LENGTH=58 /DNA_ID=CAMNT_0051526957 /DNA_START=261 /DNA_END=437 /DNA_ORIENTATION=-